MTKKTYFSCLKTYIKNTKLNFMLTRKLISASIFTVLTFGIFAQNYFGPFSNDNKLWGFTDYQGKEMVSPKYVRPTYVTQKGVAGVYVPAEKRFKLINMKDEEITNSLPGVVTSFKYIIDEESKEVAEYFYFAVNKKWGIMDASGKVLFNPNYDHLSKFSGGCAVAKIGSAWFILYPDGKVYQLQQQFKGLKEFNEGMAAFTGLDGRSGFINTKGEIIIQPIYKNVGHFSNGLAWVRDFSGKVGFIDKKGKLVIQSKYDVVTPFDPIAKRATARIGKQTLILKEDGTEIITSVNITIKKFVGGVALASEAGRWGYLDKDGKWLVSPKYENAYDFSYGIGVVELGGFWGIVGADGKILLEPTYSKITEFKNGYANVKRGDKWGIINKEGKEVLAPKFIGLKEFRP